MESKAISAEVPIPIGPKAEGFRFLCRLFAAVSRDHETRRKLYACADRMTGLSKDDAVDLTMNWLYFLSRIQDRLNTSRVSSAQYLQRLLNDLHGNSGAGNKFCDLVPSGDTATSQDWTKYMDTCKRPLVSMFCQQTGAAQRFLDFLAMGFALSVGTFDSNFSLQKDEVRKVLQLCMQQLNMPIGFVFPEEVDVRSAESDGNYTKLQEFLAVSLTQALYALYPQRAENLSFSRGKAAEVFYKKYCLPEIDDDPDGLVRELLDRNRAVDDLRREWTSIWEKLRACRIGDFRGCLEQIYEVPAFEPVTDERLTGLLYCDNQAILKRFIYGAQAGKSTLLRIVGLCCAARHPFFCGCIRDDPPVFDRISKQLALNAGHYFPLMLDCRNVAENSTNPVAEAIRQLCRMMDTQNRYLSADQQLLRDSMIWRLCDQERKEGRLLLLVDNWDQMPEGLRHAIYNADDQYHVVIVSNHCRQSEKPKMRDFNYWKIAGFSADNKMRFIDKVAGDPAFYHELLASNRYLDLFADTPAELIQVLDHRGNRWDGLLTQDISNQLDRLDMPGYAVDQFFRQLARGSLEGLWLEPSSGVSDPVFRRDPDIIPGNLMKNTLYHKEIFPDWKQANHIWDYVCRHQILVCAADVPRGFRFKNQMYRYSLAADAYLTLLLGDMELGSGMINHLCQLPAVHFSYVVVLIMNRLCGVDPEDEGYRSDSILEAMYILCQCIAGYAMSLTDMDDAVHCCRALADILGGRYCQNLLSVCLNRDDFTRRRGLCQSRQILLRTYTYLYHAVHRHRSGLKLTHPSQFIRSEQEISWFRRYYPQAFEPGTP